MTNDCGLDAGGWCADRVTGSAAIPLRLIVGEGFIAHGYAKLSHDARHFAGILRALGVLVAHAASSGAGRIERRAPSQPAA